jgi:hypothetical protein
MTTNTPLDLPGLKKVAEAATPGPWSYDRPDCDASYEIAAHDGSDWELFVADCRIGRANAEFIATFDPPTVMAIIAELEAWKADAKHYMAAMGRADAEREAALPPQAPDSPKKSSDGGEK